MAIASAIRRTDSKRETQRRLHGERPNLISFNKGRVFEDFVGLLEDAGFNVTYDVLYCPAYGIPQKRHRLVLFASLFGKVNIVSETHGPDNYPSVRDQIGHLPHVAAGDTDDVDPMHRARGLSTINLSRLKASMPGGSWRDWSPELVAACHNRETGKYYNNVYGRMAWDEPAPTITTQFYNFGAGRFGHPEQIAQSPCGKGHSYKRSPEDTSSSSRTHHTI